ncbi:hypothetical protein FA95DRAFT_1557497 [Auriscalpium vulgare]|uniref:Uncharacterized protein n=1 Tax=Auriscalpium vulgare TaxID=40419 RepID=A0ACB8RXW7_9AGAM|nr:hypothetical protein FA95DRAFT_1557497 [Auriscalpium vulgare]
MLLGALTIRGSAHERRRGPAIAVLVFSALAEVYWAYTVSVSIPRQGAKESVTMVRLLPHHFAQHADPAQWHDMLFLARHALFIILPLAVHLSARQTSPEVAAAAFAPAAAQRLDTALARTHLLRYTAAATRRAPPLAARAREFWEDERQVGSAIRGDEGVRTAAAAANLGIEEGETREEGGVRNWVSSLGVSSVGAPTANGDGGMGQKEGLLRSVVRIAVRDLKTMYKPPDAP